MRLILLRRYSFNNELMNEFISIHVLTLHVFVNYFIRKQICLNWCNRTVFRLQTVCLKQGIKKEFRYDKFYSQYSEIIYSKIKSKVKSGLFT